MDVHGAPVWQGLGLHGGSERYLQVRWRLALQRSIQSLNEGG